MTSLVAESNYTNITTARDRRRMIIRNPDNTTTITHTTATAYTNSNGFSNTHGNNLNNKLTLMNSSVEKSNIISSDNNMINTKKPEASIISSPKSGEANTQNSNELRYVGIKIFENFLNYIGNLRFVFFYIF